MYTIKMRFPGSSKLLFCCRCQERAMDNLQTEQLVTFKEFGRNFLSPEKGMDNLGKFDHHLTATSLNMIDKGNHLLLCP